MNKPFKKNRNEKGLVHKHQAFFAGISR